MYSLKRTVHRKRLAVVASPPNPQSLSDLVIPENFTRYEREPGQWENFLLFDSGRESEQNRILIFSFDYPKYTNSGTISALGHGRNFFHCSTTIFSGVFDTCGLPKPVTPSAYWSAAK